MDYKKSKKAGDIIEEEILKILKKKDEDAYIDDIGKANSDWDIYLPNKDYGVEVKGDYKSQETGNLVVEVEMYGRPSALSVTKSKYWVFVDGYRFIWIEPLEIYRFIEQNQYSRTTWTGKGDSQPKYAYLLNLKDFVLHVHGGAGILKSIPKDHVLYYDNYIKLIDEIKNG